MKNDFDSLSLPNAFWKTLLLLGGLLLCLSGAAAAELRWRTELFSYMTKGQPLKTFLRTFAASQGVTIIVDPGVEGTVVGNFNLSPQTMLELASANYGLIWYYDGNVLYVYPSSEARSQVIRMTSVPVEQLQYSLTRLGLVDRRYPITYDAAAGTALVSGPKRLVELVEQTARALDQKEDVRGGMGIPDRASSIQVFPLKYAWAADYVFIQGGREQRVPGVASVLRNLYSVGSAGAVASAGAVSTRRGGASTIDKLRGLGLVGKGVAEVEQAQRRGPDAVVGPEGTASSLPQFQPDGRLNAVIIRDLPERMAAHGQLIKTLDVRPGLVEIEARIIEVRSDAMDALGFDWRLQTGRADVQIGRAPPPQLGFDNALNGVIGAAGTATGAVGTVAGAVASFRLGDAGRFLLGRVNALAEQGKANVLSTPRVTTIDNVEAVIENVNTFFVRVAGNLDVDLFSVSAGTSLRVTPLIVTEGEQVIVKLAIKIEDGNFTSSQVDTIPVVRRSTIGTQAFVMDGEALLLAGYAQESGSNTQSGVPGLSSLPVFGRLFRYEEKHAERVERLFMLTPRVVPFPTAVATTLSAPPASPVPGTAPL